MAVSKDSVFGRPPQRAECLYRQALLGEFENLSARQAELAGNSRCWLGVNSQLNALAARQAELAGISRCRLGANLQLNALAARQAELALVLCRSASNSFTCEQSKIFYLFQLIQDVRRFSLCLINPKKP